MQKSTGLKREAKDKGKKVTPVISEETTGVIFLNIPD